MKIVVNHLTRMQKGFMCVAGIDLETGRHIRPLLQSQMRTRFLARHGGPFDIAAVVDLGWTKPIGQRPAFEDHLFHRGEVQRTGEMAPAEFWRLLVTTAKPKLGEIFGTELRRCGRSSYGLDIGRGNASLGCYLPPRAPRLYIQQRHSGSRCQARIAFQVNDYEFDLCVTDIRLHGDDHVTPDEAVIERANRRMQSTEGGVILSVGLTRPYNGDDNRPPKHWLQVNNIHFQDQPNWRLA